MTTLTIRDTLAKIDALVWALERKVGPARIPIGTRVEVGSMNARGTVIGPDGVNGEALAVRLDEPYPRGFYAGVCCASADECTPLASGAVVDAATLADDQALVEAVARGINAADDEALVRTNFDQIGATYDEEARSALGALATALTERAVT